MTTLNLQAFEDWLDAYGQAWEKGDVGLVTRLFTEDATYCETPFDTPMVGISAIRQYWKEGASDGQRDVRFHYETMAVDDHRGLAQWRASFVRVPSGNVVALDGFLVAEFDGSGRCSLFREWWHRQEHVSEAA